MTNLKADRRLWLTAEKDQVVEDGDPRAAFLLAAVGRTILSADAERLKLKLKKNRVVYPDGPILEDPKKGEGEAAEKEATEEGSGKELKFGGEKESDDSDRNNEPVPEWPGRMGPEAYLKRYPTGPKAELAKTVIAAQNDGADGGS